MFVRLKSKSIERKTKYLKVHSFDCVESTNVLAKELADAGCQEGETVVALRQTAGKGRLGRSFLSERGGVYFSIVLRPKKGVSPLFITVAAAVSAARAVEAIGGNATQIKWVNDIYLNSKKVCGILTEGSFNNNGSLKYAILGVGVNLFEPKGGFPKNLPLAGSVFSKLGKKCNFLQKNRKKLKFLLFFTKNFFSFYKDLEKKEFIKEYQSRSLLNGKEITYTQNGKEYSGTVMGIDNDARLLVQTDGQTQALSHGEIQIVGMEQLLI